ncbi:high-affinity lysophosphatidic acid receptor-like [Paramacrobiotus metropolitanus]|uniref:high-affinity lysophosphatidic acid receptor-like n=1 Tax=Paramacrobiotus metropolitanus TaxID=2943436 RepID=UPI00244584DA|nr:high-affinity lysophosphatidic acid receptor-like [Paramacrobiotus metropolitanus]
MLLLDKALRSSSFNVYIITLFTSNLLYAAVDGPVKILTMAATGWRLGRSFCTLSLYAIYVLAPMTLHTHLLISLNRAWALFWPIGYRNYHTAKTAGAICVIMVFYVHAWQLPGVILDALYYRLSPEKGCWLNRAAIPVYAALQNWTQTAPTFFVPLCYPFLLLKYYLRKRKIAERSAGNNGGLVQVQQPLRKKAGQPFLITTMFTVAFTVCWLPTPVFYLMTESAPNAYPVFRQFQAAAYSLLPILDPILFCLTIRYWQDSTRRLWRTYVSRPTANAVDATSMSRVVTEK